jgi:3-dehydroquinate synthase
MADAGAAVASGPVKVAVDLGPRSYDILIGRGLLPSAGAEIARRIPKARAAIVTDQTVAKLHLAALGDSLRAAGIDHTVATVPAGEESKSFAVLEKVVDAILAARLERGDVVVALGGGVVGDLAGFAAAIVRRGMRVVQVPTTLLAAVDSAIGGKTGINTARGKNLIGAFHQPTLVLTDSTVLDTLPRRTFNAGYAEVVKYGLLGDARFFEWLESNWRGIVAGGPEREQAIAQSARAKARVVSVDEREEAGPRALLNLGHTFGHALEAAAGFSDRLLHGEAVAIGMALAFAFSAKRGLCKDADAARVIAHLKAVGLPTRIAHIPGEPLTVERLMTLVAQDKKVARGRLTFILVRGIGQAFVARDIPPNDVAAFLEERLTT